MDELKIILDKQEIFYIGKYDSVYPNGYNIQTGGNNTPKKETMVYQFDKLGNFIQEYKSATEASRQTKTDKSGIFCCINGTQATAGGYIWSRDKVIHKTDVKVKQRKINVYDLNNNYLMQFDSVLDASIKMFDNKNKISGISHCLRNITKTAYGYIWKYAD